MSQETDSPADMGPMPDDVGLSPEAKRAAALASLRLPDEALAQECVEQFFIAGGPGGQHRNKTETGVRLQHRPTGVTVTATERRSQFMNRQEALERLRAALARLTHVEKKRVATKPSRGQKRRRLQDKRFLAEKKKSRRGEW